METLCLYSGTLLDLNIHCFFWDCLNMDDGSSSCVKVQQFGANCCHGEYKSIKPIDIIFLISLTIWASVCTLSAKTKYDNALLKRVLPLDTGVIFVRIELKLSSNFLSRHIASLPCRTQKKPSPPLVTFSTSSHRSQNTKYLLPNF